MLLLNKRPWAVDADMRFHQDAFCILELNIQSCFCSDSQTLTPLSPQCLRIPHLLKIVGRCSCSQTFSTQRPTERSFKKNLSAICSIYSLFLSKHDWNTHRNKYANHKYTVWNCPATDRTHVASRQIKKQNIESPYCLLWVTSPNPRVTGILTRNSID